MAIELITGRAGTPHVDSADVGALNAALFGAGAYVLEGIDAELVDANNVRVSAGEMLCEGRHIRITGDGETLTIDNGTSAYKRHDIIAAKYLRGEDGVETVTLVVIKGSNSTNAPQDPAMPRQGKVIDGAAEAYWPLYRIVIDGLTPQTPAFIAQRQAVYTLGLGTEIPAGADLNDYTEPGVYRYTPRLVRNAPAVFYQDDNHVLIVRAASDERPMQESFNRIGLERWARGSFSTGYSDWYCNGGVSSIVQAGFDSGWYWSKYSDGTCELYGSIVVGALADQVWGNDHYASFEIGLPIKLTQITAYAGCGNNTSYLWFVGLIGGGTRISCYLANGHGLNNADQDCKILLTGRWK